MCACASSRLTGLPQQNDAAPLVRFESGAVRRLLGPAREVQRRLAAVAIGDARSLELDGRSRRSQMDQGLLRTNAPARYVLAARRVSPLELAVRGLQMRHSIVVAVMLVGCGQAMFDPFEGGSAGGAGGASGSGGGGGAGGGGGNRPCDGTKYCSTPNTSSVCTNGTTRSSPCGSRTCAQGRCGLCTSHGQCTGVTYRCKCADGTERTGAVNSVCGDVQGSQMFCSHPSIDVSVCNGHGGFDSSFGYLTSGCISSVDP